MNLQDKHVVIIGGSSGIGLAVAKATVQAGGKVTIASRDQEKLLAAQKQLQGKAAIKSLDVRSEEQIQKFFSEVGRFDHLVTPGSASSSGACLELDSKVAKESFDGKFWGQYFAVKYGAPKMSKEGSIVLFSGVLSQRPMPNTAVMASINGGVEALGRALAIELAPIRVNVISPGYVDTPRLASLKDKFAHQVKQLPLGRIGTPEEAAQAVLFLLTNDYMTASTLFFDGGYTMR